MIWLNNVSRSYKKYLSSLGKKKSDHKITSPPSVASFPKVTFSYLVREVLTGSQSFEKQGPQVHIVFLHNQKYSSRMKIYYRIAKGCGEVLVGSSCFPPYH